MMSFGKKADAARAHTSGFDALRLILAVGILCFHSTFVTRGDDAVAWHLPYRPLSSLMLPMFFALSGYLVAGSFFRTETLAQFLTLRVLRIVPALFVEVVLCALVLGPTVTSLPLSDYFSAPEFRTYWFNVIGFIHYFLPGVFHENPLPIVNLSLWTVPFELECYVGLAILAAGTLLYRPKLLVTAFAALSIAAIA